MRFGIVDPNNLQAVNYDLFVVENGYPDSGQRRKVWGTITDLFVITRYEICSGGRAKAGPRFDCFRDVDHGTIKHVAANKDRGWFEFVQLLHDFANKSRPEYVTYMHVADHGNAPAMPLTRQIWQRNFVGGHVERECVDQSENRDRNRASVERQRDGCGLDRHSSQAHQPRDRPTEDCGE